MMRRALSTRVSAEKSGGLVHYLGTAETVDSYDTIIRTDGIDLRRYLANPVVTVDHMNSVRSIIGKSETVERQEKPIKGLEFGVRFATGASEIADQAERLARAGFLAGASISFNPTRMRVDMSDAERDLLGLGRFGAIIEECELIELALVAIPSNPDTLKRALATGAIRESDARWMESRDADKIDLMLARLESVSSQVTEGIEELTEVLVREIQNGLSAVASAIARLGATQKSYDIAQARLAALEQVTSRIGGGTR